MRLNPLIPALLFLLLPLPAQQPGAQPTEPGGTATADILPGAETEDTEAGDADADLPTAPVEEEAGDPTAPIARALVRVSAAIQPHSFVQPWQRVPLQRRASLGVAIEGSGILTTAASVRDASFLELQAASGGGRVPAVVRTIDHELNLAILEPEEEAPFLDALRPVALAQDVELGDTLELWQLEVTGQFSKTEGNLVRGAVVGYPGPLGVAHLAGELRMVVQTRPNSQAAPFVKEGRLAGLLMGYDARQQTARMLPLDLIDEFLQRAAAEGYEGGASFDFNWYGTEDRTFREWLQLPVDLGGVYIGELAPEGGALDSGLKPGDVLIAVDDEPIDARGFVGTEDWGRVNFSHLILGRHAAGETVELTVWRDGEQVELEVELASQQPWEQLVPAWLPGRGPNYLVLGGAMLQELTMPYLAETQRVSDASALEIARLIENPDAWLEDHERVVLWCYAIPTPATFGYEWVNHLIVETVNGEIAADLAAVAAAVDATPAGELIELGVRGEPGTIYLDPEVVRQVNGALVEQGLVPLRRLEAYGPDREEAGETTVESTEPTPDAGQELPPTGSSEAEPESESGTGAEAEAGAETVAEEVAAQPAQSN